jgi:acetoin utilization deacetylase AcuC-like enzyme
MTRPPVIMQWALTTTAVMARDGGGSVVPLPKGAMWDDVYGRALRDDVMVAISQFDPSALVVSLGLDTHEGDDVAVNRGGFALRDRDYYEMGLCMGRCMAGKRVPCVFVQEGGYKMDVVGDAASDVVGGYAVGVSSGEEEEERGGGGGGGR